MINDVLSSFVLKNFYAVTLFLVTHYAVTLFTNTPGIVSLSIRPYERIRPDTKVTISPVSSVHNLD